MRKTHKKALRRKLKVITKAYAKIKKRKLENEYFSIMLNQLR